MMDKPKSKSSDKSSATSTGMPGPDIMSKTEKKPDVSTPSIPLSQEHYTFYSRKMSKILDAGNFVSSSAQRAATKVVSREELDHLYMVTFHLMNDIRDLQYMFGYFPIGTPAGSSTPSGSFSSAVPGTGVPGMAGLSGGSGVFSSAGLAVDASGPPVSSDVGMALSPPAAARNSFAFAAPSPRPSYYFMGMEEKKPSYAPPPYAQYPSAPPRASWDFPRRDSFTGFPRPSWDYPYPYPVPRPEIPAPEPPASSTPAPASGTPPEKSSSRKAEVSIGLSVEEFIINYQNRSAEEECRRETPFVLIVGPDRPRNGEVDRITQSFAMHVV
eukprot:TRINITY_DN1518_c0_g1_i4.p1 TRINITY_DN1518_c0_g1~~TRINITY_DN1518_c0_g1_i4.p1  ORF type:complete len:327 (-),score=-23.54 TRINITY_DN1518_c0_g1_i4:198-1178(-)